MAEDLRAPTDPLDSRVHLDLPAPLVSQDETVRQDPLVRPARLVPPDTQVREVSPDNAAHKAQRESPDFPDQRDLLALTDREVFLAKLAFREKTGLKDLLDLLENAVPQDPPVKRVKGVTVDPPDRTAPPAGQADRERGDPRVPRVWPDLPRSKVNLATLGSEVKTDPQATPAPEAKLVLKENKATMDLLANPERQVPREKLDCQD